MRVVILLVLVAILGGCSSDEKFEQVGLYSDKSYVELKKEYMSMVGVETSDELINRLGNMLAVANTNKELSWTANRLFFQLQEQHEYVSLISYIKQLKQRGLSDQMMADVLYAEADANHMLSKNRWAEKMGVNGYYRNYNYLNQSATTYMEFLTSCPNDKRTKEARRVLAVIKKVLKEHDQEVADLNKRKRYI